VTVVVKRCHHTVGGSNPPTRTQKYIINSIIIIHLSQYQ
jgi:hypothetical protein